MIRYVMAVRDRAADSFGQPFFVAALGQGVRMFIDEVNREGADNALFAHPEDFDLYVVGEYDDLKGVLCPAVEGPRMLSVGKDVKR